jgi:hypothetical protein
MRHRLGISVGLATVAVLWLGAGQAQAKVIDTDFGDTGVNCLAGPDADHCLYSGFITSKDKCLANRKVKMFRLLTGGETRLVDTDRTSGNGAFAGIGRPSEVSAAKFKVLREKRGNDVCGGAHFTGA